MRINRITISLIRSWFVGLFVFSCLTACNKRETTKTISLLKEWNDKSISFPTKMTFTVQGKDTVHFPIQKKYKIVTYVDPTGCISCKLQLHKWTSLINSVDSTYPNSVQFLFFFYPKKNRDVYQTLRSANFKHPVCIDEKDSLNKLNEFPTETVFQTFLLSKEDRVMAIGNPILNPKVKELFLNIISGKNIRQKQDIDMQTLAIVDKQLILFGDFDWKVKQKAVFELKNTGSAPLVINDVATSCGCTSVEYTKEPIRPGKTAILNVVYQAEHPEHFDKTITVYCNASSSPIRLKIRGNAQ